MKLLKFWLASIIGGTVLFIIFPYLLIQLNDTFQLPGFSNAILRFVGILFMILGTINFLYCTDIMIKHGKGGTPLITEPPKDFIKDGFYKYSRNPIYIGHLLIVFGEFLLFGKLFLFFYVVALAISLHALLIIYEEPQLKKRYGRKYLEYTNQIPRWL